MTAYFDNAATTRVCDEALKVTLRLMQENFGNPSSAHKLGREAKAELDTARKNVADTLSALPEEIFFTSGGTEADNWAVFGAAEAMRHKGRHIITTSIEHEAIRRPIERLAADGAEITYLKPDKNGRVLLSEFQESLREDTVLVSVMLVNNETGAVNPVGEMSKILRKAGSRALLHTDAVQGFCKIPFTAKELGADLITLSSHKIHGPKGAGALYIKKGIKIPPRIYGGGQEKGYRSGTEGLPAIGGFGEAARIGKILVDKTSIYLAELRALAIEEITARISNIIIIGSGDAPNILSISLPGYRSEVLMNYLDAAGICVSKGSACKKGGRSYVLEEMKIPNKVIDGAIRLSFSRENTKEEVIYFVQKLFDASQSLVTASRRGN